MAQDIQTAIAAASKAAERALDAANEAKAINGHGWQDANRKPGAPDVYRCMYGVFRRWDGKNWHKGSRDYDLAAKTDSALDREQWVPWAPVSSDYAKGTARAATASNGHANPLVAQGRRLVLLGRALQDPDISVHKLMQMSEEAGFPLDITFKGVRGA